MPRGQPVPRIARSWCTRHLPALVAMLCVGAGVLAAEPRRTVAVTFDDLPGNRAEASTAEEQVALNQAIVETLVRREIPAIGFVNEEKLVGNGAVEPARVKALEVWLDGGLDLGNHTYAHPDLHRMPLEEFEQQVLDGERITRRLLAARGKAPRWFRHPFLHTGPDLETKRAFEAFLDEHGYRVAPVTIDNSEWIFARAYLNTKANGTRDEVKRIADEYVAYMERKVAYYERQSVALFDREIPQVLLVHANHLNAEHFDRIAAMLEARGYHFVPLEQAVADEAYATRDTYTGRGGITWLHRWAISTGRRDCIVPDEPTSARFVLDAAGIESE